MKLQSIQIAPPAAAIWALDEIKAHCRVQHDAENDLLTAYAEAAVAQLDGIQGGLQRALINQTWSDRWPSLDRVGVLRLAPVVSIERVYAINSEGAEVALEAAKSRKVITALGAELVLDDDAFAGVTLANIEDAIRCDYVAGYGADRSSVPAPIKQAHRLLVGHYYANREAVRHVAVGRFETLPMGVRALLGPYRRYGVNAWVS